MPSGIEPAADTARSKTICLAMIVKNEAKVIERCLLTVKPLLDYWVICDTGSTDGTQAIIRSLLADIPGELHEQSWINYGVNRSQCLDLAKTHGAYLLIVDADDVVVNGAAISKADLCADSYYARDPGCALQFDRPFLLRSELNWQYVGAAHEHAVATGSQTRVLLTETGLHHHGDGSNRATKLTRELALLKQDLKENTDNARTWFYLGRTYECLRDWPQAIAAFRERVRLGGWLEEQFFAQYSVGLCEEASGCCNPTVAYLSAHAMRPHRAEPLYRLARYCYNTHQWASGYLFGAAALAIPYPAKDRLFIDTCAYGASVADVTAICAYRAGRISDAIRWGTEAVRRDSHNSRLRKNLDNYIASSESSISPSPKTVMATNGPSTSRILVFGLPKSGTTLMLQRIAAAVPDHKRYFETAADPGTSHLVCKRLLYRELTAELPQFDRRVFIVRDPRDRLISCLLYAPYALFDTCQQIREYLALLRKKEQDPRAVTCRQLADYLGYKHYIPQTSCDRWAAQWAKSPAIVAIEKHVIRYEDLIQDDVTALEQYLGFRLAPAGIYPGYRRVLRTGTAGDWRHWLTPEDCEWLREKFAAYMELFGYDTADWDLQPKPRILPKHCSEYLANVFRERDLNQPFPSQ